MEAWCGSVREEPVDRDHADGKSVKGEPQRRSSSAHAVASDENAEQAPDRKHHQRAPREEDGREIVGADFTTTFCDPGIDRAQTEEQRDEGDCKKRNEERPCSQHRAGGLAPGAACQAMNEREAEDAERYAAGNRQGQQPALRDCCEAPDQANDHERRREQHDHDAAGCAHCHGCASPGSPLSATCARVDSCSARM